MRKLVKAALAGKTFFLFSLMVVLFSYAFTEPVNGGSTADKIAVLQLSLDIPALQSYLPSDANGNKQAVRVLQHPVSFSSDIQLTKNGMPVIFLGQRDGTQGLDAYINFTEFDVQENSASVFFNITYDRNTSTPNSRKVSVKLTKNQGNWSITESSINQ